MEEATNTKFSHKFYANFLPSNGYSGTKNRKWEKRNEEMGKNWIEMRNGALGNGNALNL